jgi:hypothetical protein
MLSVLGVLLVLVLFGRGGRSINVGSCSEVDDFEFLLKMGVVRLEFLG